MTQTLLKLDFNERSDKNSLYDRSNAYSAPLWRYPERQPLEEKIAKLNQLSTSQVLCTNGGDEAIMLLMRIIKESCQLILPLPAFSQYILGIQTWQLAPQLIAPNSDLSINLEQLRQTLTNTSNSVIVITRPNNPTGELITELELLELLNISKINNNWIFLDEAYIEFSQQIAISNRFLSQFDNLIILRTLSKAYGLAGIRLGYLLGSEKLIAQFKQRCLPFNISQPTLSIASQALDNSNRQEVEQYCQQIIINREKISCWLSNKGINFLPSQANFVLLQLPPKQAKAIQSFLSRNSILVKTFEDPDLQHCLRITIPYQITQLLKLLQQALTPKLICLDMDGVLIDTSDSYDKTIKACVDELTGKKVSQQQIEQLRAAGGFNNDWLLTQKLLNEAGFEISIQEVTKLFQKRYLGNNNDGFVRNEIPLITENLINKINTQKNTQFAIVTGRPKQEANAGKKLLSLEMLETISLDDVTAPKPSPEGIKKLQDKYSPSSWMCGDNPDDMQAAVASNSLAIGIGSTNADALYQAGADIVLKDINLIEDWLCPLN